MKISVAAILALAAACIELSAQMGTIVVPQQQKAQQQGQAEDQQLEMAYGQQYQAGEQQPDATYQQQKSVQPIQKQLQQQQQQQQRQQQQGAQYQVGSYAEAQLAAANAYAKAQSAAADAYAKAHNMGAKSKSGRGKYQHKQIMRKAQKHSQYTRGVYHTQAPQSAKQDLCSSVAKAKKEAQSSLYKQYGATKAPGARHRAVGHGSARKVPRKPLLIGAGIELEQGVQEEPTVPAGDVSTTCSTIPIVTTTCETVAVPPVTEEPTIVEPPVTEVPPTELPPVTEEPTIVEPPVTEEPTIVEPPVTEEPTSVEVPPVTEEPTIVEPPVTEEPTIVEPPVTEEPTIVEPPVTEEPTIVEPPVTEEPTIVEPPITEVPPTELPTELPPVTEEPTIVEPPVTASTCISMPTYALDLREPQLANVSSIFRLTQNQFEYPSAQDFCSMRPAGVYCYTPSTCDNICLAGSMISCPEGIILRCVESHICVTNPMVCAGQGSACLAISDLLSPGGGGGSGGARSGGENQMYRVQLQQSGRLVDVTQKLQTMALQRCSGPTPAYLEKRLQRCSVSRRRRRGMRGQRLSPGRDSMLYSGVYAQGQQLNNGDDDDDDDDQMDAGSAQDESDQEDDEKNTGASCPRARAEDDDNANEGNEESLVNQRFILGQSSKLTRKQRRLDCELGQKLYTSGRQRAVGQQGRSGKQQGQATGQQLKSGQQYGQVIGQQLKSGQQYGQAIGQQLGSRQQQRQSIGTGANSPLSGTKGTLAIEEQADARLGTIFFPARPFRRRTTSRRFRRRFRRRTTSRFRRFRRW